MDTESIDIVSVTAMQLWSVSTVLECFMLWTKDWVCILAFHTPVQEGDTIMAPTGPQCVSQDKQRAPVLVWPPLHQHQEAWRFSLDVGPNLKMVNLLSGEA